MLPGQLFVLSQPRGVRVKLTGDYSFVEQKQSKYIGRMGRFWIKQDRKWGEQTSSQGVVVGKVRWRLLDVLLGRVWVDTERVELSPGVGLGQIAVSSVGTTRLWLINRVGGSLPEPEAGLVLGVLFGYKDGLARDFYQNLINSGTVHIAVASGYNLAVVGESMLLMLFVLFRRKQATIVAILMMYLYTLITGWQAPIVRALIMVTLVMIARAIGRKSAGGWTLWLSCWVMVFVNPLIIESVSFQLTVAATAGLVLWEERIAKISGFLRYVAPTMSTFLMTAPIIWWYFGRVSWVGLTANVLVLPLVPILMFLGVLVVVLGPMGGFFTYPVAHVIVLLVKFFGS